MKITLAEAIRLGTYKEPCVKGRDEEDYPRNTDSDLYFVAQDETNAEECDENARRTVKIIFKMNDKLYSFEEIIPYWDEGDYDIKLAEGQSTYSYGDEYTKDKSVLVACTPVTKKTRMVEETYYE